MKLIKSSFEILDPTGYTIDDIYKSIELAGRVCYKSEDKITDNSAKEFVNRIIKSGHGAMLEHGTVYLAIPYDFVDVSCRLEVPIVSDVVEKYKRNPYTKWWTRYDEFSRLAFITTNYRVLVENDWLNDLQYLCKPTEFHEKRITVRFICDRGISHEFVRHRVFSFAQESTRYCNYSKDKFNNELTFIIPCWYNVEDGDYGTKGYLKRKNVGNKNESFSIFRDSLIQAEHDYFNLLKEGQTPQQARNILPNSLKTELVMTGTISQWQGFFKLRCDKAAQPQARELATSLKEEFIKRNYINE